MEGRRQPPPPFHRKLGVLLCATKEATKTALEAALHELFVPIAASLLLSSCSSSCSSSSSKATLEAELVAAYAASRMQLEGPSPRPDFAVVVVADAEIEVSPRLHREADKLDLTLILRHPHHPAPASHTPQGDKTKQEEEGEESIHQLAERVYSSILSYKEDKSRKNPSKKNKKQTLQQRQQQRRDRLAKQKQQSGNKEAKGGGGGQEEEKNPYQFVPVGTGKIALKGRPRLGDEIPCMPHWGITHVVTLQGSHERADEVRNAVEKAGMGSLWVDVASAKYVLMQQGPSVSKMVEALRQAFELLNSPSRAVKKEGRGEEGVGMLIHCAAGLHRTGTFAYCLLRMGGYTEKQARMAICVLRKETSDGVGAQRLDLAERVLLPKALGHSVASSSPLGAST